MKKMFGLTRRILAVGAIALMSSAVLTSCDKNDDNNNNNANSNMYTISGNASGGQMVPSVAGNGAGTITGTYNANTGVLNYTTNWTGLSGAPTTGGFYNGASGTAGTAVGSSWNMGTGLTSTGSRTGQMTLTSDQATQLRNGNWYYTLGTANNSNGEVRGQITTTAMQ
jgi:CHRD domain